MTATSEPVQANCAGLGISLLGDSRTATLLLLPLDPEHLVLQSLRKREISYRIGTEPTVYKGSSQHTFLSKAYRRYVFCFHNNCSTLSEQIFNNENKEV